MDASRHGAALKSAHVAKVEFQCYAPLGFGEEVVVSGDAPVLGNGDVARGVALRTSAATYPVWTTSEPVAVFAGVQRYRYAVFSAGAFDRWESFEGNQERRVALVDAGITTCLSDKLECEGLRPWTEADAARLKSADTSAQAVAQASLDAKEAAPRRGVAFAQPQNETQGSLTVEVPFGSPRGRQPTTYVAATERSSARPASKKMPKSPLKEPSPRSKYDDEQRDALNEVLGDEAPGAGALAPTDGVVVASLFLPVLIKRDTEGKLQISWDHENLLSLQTPLRVTRVGIARTPDDCTEREKQDIVERLRRQPWCAIAIFLDAETFRLFYHSFCKGILWPVFHNSVEVYGEQSTPLLEFDDIFQAPTNKEEDDRVELLAAAAGSAAALERDVLSHSRSGTSFGSGSYGSPTGSNFSEAGEQSPSPKGPGRPRSPDEPKGQVTTNDERAWHAYKRANQVFLKAVVEAYNQGDLVWIHGFQLLLLPAFVSRRLAAARIGIFLHTPFPSSEIFRTLSMRSELLRGVLGADRIGFHLFEYARHFVTNVRRLLGIKNAFDSRGVVLDVDGRDVIITCVHAGVEPAALSRVAALPETEQARKSLSTTLGLGTVSWNDGTHIIIAGIDKLENLRGLPLKLLAYERFLDEAEARGAAPDTRLVQYALASPERAADAMKVRRDCLRLVDRIRAKHGDQTVVWREVLHLNIEERLALLGAADVFWVSSVRDGLNRWPLEYVAVQYDAIVQGGFDHDQATKPYFDAVLERAADCCGGAGYPCGDPCTDFVPKGPHSKRGEASAERKALAAEVFPGTDRASRERRVTLEARTPGTLVLSDSSSASRVLLGATVANPWLIDEGAAALRNALAMRPRERLARLAKDARFLARATTGKWAYRVLADLKTVPRDRNPLRATHAGLGLGFRILGMKSGFDALQVDRVARAYRQAGQDAPSAAPTEKGGFSTTGASRVVVLDYGGTLVPEATSVGAVASYAIASGTKKSPKPSDEVLGVLAALARDPRNVVFVVSGRERVHLLDGLAGPGLADLGLAAEHGFFVRWPKALRDVGPATANVAALARRGGAVTASPGPHDKAPPPPPASPEQRSPRVNDGDWDRAAPRRGGWRAQALTIMDMFARQTHGTYVERHESCLVWQYRDADPDFGEMQATELESQLRLVLAPYGQVQVLRGANSSRGGYVEVRPAGVDKGALLRRVLKALEAAGRPADFALVVGDDASDEAMFRELRKWQSDLSAGPATRARRSARAFSVTVGKKPSDAESYVDAHDNLVEMLEALARVSNRGARYMSSHDFAGEYASACAAVRDDFQISARDDSDDRASTTSSSAPSDIPRSLSMPAFGQAATQPRRRPVARKNSWLSFQDAFQVAPAQEAEAPIIEEGDEEADDAAMFF